ncbi:gamma-glutamylcyclotransferase family protein [Nitrincola sp.]|uniref:gamma-glutamylcyclotransferase family protein n=1 Tax=Nitrincola sp. TaxID=1926584 RepID=UPI003A8E0BFF
MCFERRKHGSKKCRKRLVWVAFGLVLLLPLYLWLVLLSPFFYTPPEHLPALKEGTHRVFAFGTLKSPWVRFVVMGRVGVSEEALLPGKRREGLNIIADPTAQTPGLVFEVNATELVRLDRYERLGVRYERVKMTLHDGSQAWVYRRLQAAESASY